MPVGVDLVLVEALGFEIDANTVLAIGIINRENYQQKQLQVHGCKSGVKVKVNIENVSIYMLMMLSFFDLFL